MKTLAVIKVALLVALVMGPSALLAEDMVIDGSTMESYERSIKAMKDTLSDQDKKAFGRGLLIILLREGYPALQSLKNYSFRGSFFRDKNQKLDIISEDAKSKK
ncbi:MAG: hypothetical protein V6Z86_07345 [Hyphomicrobiales bacterium]